MAELNERLGSLGDRVSRRVVRPADGGNDRGLKMPRRSIAIQRPGAVINADASVNTSSR